MNNRLMRILVFFDLPVKTKAERGAATKFRNFLLMDGYHMVQLSVYARICNGTDSVAAHKLRLAAAVPSKGSVRMLVITEKQYSNIQILLGKPTVYDEPQQMEQLMLF
ncbi:CRISPR-associated endonuclease Cas2 [uncultured Oscillibacter sp.]|jgi:CRISPR-associated protein Cas2|uniref:CRISPR-associated endonuclease Cas2 n=1 Tax=uncultured Oscillibacter sp. TaxID=876091 RepID=UPI0026286A4A|nr:CRISPR-associated endonuclease Cas2 [uncultured Oscillibacter sp.]